MRKIHLGLSVAALALACGTVALAQRGEHPNPDANGDGAITLAEMQAHGGEMFARMDATGDGVLNQDDRGAHGAQMFAKADTDGSGELSPEEMTAAHEARRGARAQKREDRMARHFATADTDRSGGLSQDELHALHAARGEAGPGRPRHGGARHGGFGGPMMLLHMADADGDKAVTRAEFDKAIAAHFAKIDADGDGSVSAVERRAAHKAMRERRGAHGES
ncbi:MAG: EF-hand domain-containing protein [Erythrobacter sp.]|jgi:Ca2+-binding EF-hand superfamily protein